jgi:hypothetical protein
MATSEADCSRKRGLMCWVSRAMLVDSVEGWGKS